MGDSGKTCLVVLTALRFTPEYGQAALEVAARRRERVVLCLVVDREIPEVVSGQLADVGFLGEKLMHDLRRTMIAEYRSRGLEHLDELEKQARSLGLEVERRVLEGPFLESVLAAARECGATRITVSRLLRAHISRVVFGSDIDRLLKQARCPVVVYSAGSTACGVGGGARGRPRA